VVSCEASITTRSTLGTGKSSARLGSGACAKNGRKTKLNGVRVSYTIRPTSSPRLRCGLRCDVDSNMLTRAQPSSLSNAESHEHLQRLIIQSDREVSLCTRPLEHLQRSAP
jgi:hypothetical protein